jgi:hypothetical protein
MHDRIDPLFPDDSGDQIGIRDIAFIKGDIFRNGPAKSGDKIVDDNRSFTGIEQSQDGMTANIARAACDEDIGFSRHICILRNCGLRGTVLDPLS